MGGPLSDACRDAISPFCELLKSPEHVHTYRITPISVWNAASSGMSAQAMAEALARFSRFDVPRNVLKDVSDLHGRYGRLRLERAPAPGTGLVLFAADPADAPVLEEVSRNPLVRDLLGPAAPGGFSVDEVRRGEVKQALVRIGWPLEDLAGYVEGGPLSIALRERTPDGRPFALRDYQRDAVSAFHQDGRVAGGSGVIVLPCGSGKTIVGLGAMARIGRKTLILTTNHTAVVQWRAELLAKTDLPEDAVGEYTGETKEIRPVTIATYQILTWRRSRTDPFVHFEIFQRNDWGLVIYDEVHLLPAPVFRVTAGIQATRRLGLTATLLREDGREDDVFSLIGPKRYDVPWKVLERRGFIAEAACTEVRVPLPRESRDRYAVSDRREQFRVAAENPDKLPVLDRLLERHRSDLVLVIGQYLDQLDEVARRLRAPLVCGRTPPSERKTLYGDFRSGRLRVLVVSKVGNFAVDLPDASVLVQLSGTFGSRQEEAQRLGRILRPKGDGRSARFYTLVSRETNEQDFAQHRQLFLTEQGYAYDIVDAEHVLDGDGGEGGGNGTAVAGNGNGHAEATR
jgi:DNA excision repair protein ERCC-3